MRQSKATYLAAAEDLKQNDGQWQAYQSEGHCVVLAGPGSGKTKVLTVKLARILAEDIAGPRGIACITFNNQCARELRSRLASLGIRPSNKVFVGTLHSFCLKHIVLPFAKLGGVVKAEPIQVATEEESRNLRFQAAKEIVGTPQWGPQLDRYRRTHLDRSAKSWREDDEESAAIVERYEELLDQAGLIDFDGMVLIAHHLLSEHDWVRKVVSARFPVLVVDEYQDLGHGINEIVRILCLDGGSRLLAVGDPDQCIYAFTGAEPSLLETLSKREDVETVRLNLNYRSGSKIIRASEGALPTKRGFKSRTGADPGEVYFHEIAGGLTKQAEYICDQLIPDALQKREGRRYGDIAVLYIDKNDGDVIAREVAKRGWQYIRVDGNNPYQPSPMTYWLEDCASWCAGEWQTGQVRLSSLIARWEEFNDNASLIELRASRKSIIQYLARNRDSETSLRIWLNGIMDAGVRATLENEVRLKDDKGKVEALIAAASDTGPFAGVSVAFLGGQGGSPEHLRLSTLHSAKGLEYDVVIIAGLEEGRIPYFNDDAASVVERRRLFYVGLTRARHQVHLLYSGFYANKYGRTFAKGASRFVAEIRDELAS